MVPHFVCIQNEMDEVKTANNGANRCLTRYKNDTVVLNTLGVEVQEVVIFGYDHPLLLCGMGKLLLI